MNPRDPLPGDEPGQDPTLSRLYRELPDVAPSADTDALIRAAARRAVGAGPHRGFVAAHWRGMGSAAAALLLGVALTVQWRTQQAGRLDEALATAPPAAPAAGKADDTAIDALFADEAPKADSAPARAPSAPAAKAAVAEEATREPKRAGAGVAPMAPPPAAAPAPMEMREAPAVARDARSVVGAQLQGQAGTLDGALAPSQAAAPPPAAAPAPLKKSIAAAPATAEAQAAGMAAARSARTDASVMKEEAANEAARERSAAGALADRQAAAAPAASPAAADYRAALAAGHYAEALDLLADPATPAARLDRDLLRQWLRPGAPLDCAGSAAAPDAALLCEGLVRRAAGQAPTPEWRRRVEAAGLASGANAYRRGLLEKLFGVSP